MEHEISFAPCYDLYHEMGARPGFSFVDTAKFRAGDCTDGNWEDITLHASCDQPGDAVNAICCAMLRKAGRSYITSAEPSAVSFESLSGTIRSDRPEPWLPYVFTSPEEAAEAGVL
jgi:hypothetical protein